MVMNAEERLYGMMAVVEEQQKVLSTSLAEFKSYGRTQNAEKRAIKNR